MVSVTRLSFIGFLIVALAGPATAIPLTLPGTIAGNTPGTNGFGDWNLAGLLAGATVMFHANSDVAESFSLIQTTVPPVSEASSMQLMLAGAGLLGLGYFLRRRKGVKKSVKP